MMQEYVDNSASGQNVTVLRGMVSSMSSSTFTLKGSHISAPSPRVVANTGSGKSERYISHSIREVNILC